MMRSDNIPTLPPELITEILSRLHWKSLSRAQLVSKEWQALISDHYLIEKHMDRSPSPSHLWHNEYTDPATLNNSPKTLDSFQFMHGIDGVIVIKNTTSKKYFLWNPATARVLELPDPHSGIIGLSLMYVPATRNYRVVSIYKDKKLSGEVGCQVLTPGLRMSWKGLAFPDLPKAEKVFVVPAGGDVHCVLITKDGKDTTVVTLDVEEESFTINRPTGAFDYAGTVDWDGKLGFVNVVGDTLELIKLEDYKKQKWGVDKEIIPLPFRKKPRYQGRLCPLLNRKGEIWFWIEGKEKFTYNIETGKVDLHAISKALSYKESQIYSYKPSLLNFEGMREDSDTDLPSYRPRNLN